TANDSLPANKTGPPRQAPPLNNCTLSADILCNCENPVQHRLPQNKTGSSHGNCRRSFALAIRGLPELQPER
ncbi:hypothetical protein LJD42_27545, partial [Escherichia coli]|nr:hypothetical protein [Escherichia coli]